MRKLSWCLLMVVGAPAPAVADPLDAIWAKLQPARAVYMLRQRGEGTGDAPVMAGRMVIEAKLTCNDLATSMSMELRVTAGAQSMSVLVEQQATEARDGKVYRFMARSAFTADGEAT